MSPNQRLIVAVLLSVIFFVGYTAIFPPVEHEVAENAQSTINKSTNSATVKDTVDTEAGHVVSSVESLPVDAGNTILTVTSKDFILKMDTLGRISSKELLDARYRNKDDGHAQLIPSTGTKPLYLRFMDEALNKEASSVAYTANSSEVTLVGEAKKVVLTQNLTNLTITKTLTFFTDGHYDVEIAVSQDKRYYVYLGQRPRVNESEQMMTVVGAMVYTTTNEDELVTIIEDGDAEGRKAFSAVALISAFDQYTASIMYGFDKERNIIVERDREDNPVVYFDGLQNIKFNGYVGQKNYKTLKAINPVLTNAIEYGWFTFAAKPLFALLSWLYSIFGNWGWSIIALTAIIRFVLYPLTYKGMVSMQKMKQLTPKMKELKEKYKGDPARLNKATMDMYKKNGANPLGGCLPMLMQIPVFFAIYRVLLNAEELQGAEWILWVNDLSRMDPYYVLPLLMGASMFFQQKLTPTTFTDPMQEKVMKFLPVIFTFFFITFPSGLVLYWFVNNLFSILQQFIVNQQFKNAKDAKEAIAIKSEK
jgi:YidC/Oxa1 family membrane protein insertase